MAQQENVSRRNVLTGASLIGLSTLMKGCATATTNTGTNTGNIGGPQGGSCTAAIDVSKGLADAGNPDCVVTPELTEGPYYVNVNLLRQDVTEGKTGVPLALTIKLVEATSCTPLSNIAVEIWHCDALGSYSDEAVENTLGQTFLRGTQMTDAAGQVTFNTIYPGWYSGRTVHIHARAHLSSSKTVTTQFIFDDDLTDTVFANNAPYNTRNSRDTRNTCDMVVEQTDHGDPIFLKIAADNNGGYTATITIGVT